MTTVSAVTPAGRSAVATVIVRGESAVEIVSKLFVPAGPTPFAARDVDSISFGTWVHTQATAEDVVVAKRTIDDPNTDAANSDTLISTIEIHCHGGTEAVRSIVNSLVELGCQELEWQQLSRQTPHSPIVHDANIALASAQTEKTAAILLDQLRGALDEDIGKIIQHLQSEKRDEANELLEELLSRWDAGRHLTVPWKVVLAGPPNVGKSSLINALLGYERAIVFDQPGTTRDIVAAETAVDGWLISLSDTAGIRQSGDEIERRGVDQARSVAADADLVILVHDSTQNADLEIDQSLAAISTRTITVLNKIDLSENGEACDARVSAVTMEGIPQLLDLISTRLIGDPPQAGAAVPFATHHQAAIENALTASQQGDFAAAISTLAGCFCSDDSTDH